MTIIVFVSDLVDWLNRKRVTNIGLLRVRFKANYEDSRPVDWPVKYPFWETGRAADGSYAIVVSYADSVDYITAHWPEASDVEVMEENAQVRFTDRFPKPAWF